MNASIRESTSLTLAVAAAAALAATPSIAIVPEVSGVTMSQASDRLVTIAYTLSDDPAVITLDVQTNYTENAETKWASIGGKAVSNAQGDVWKTVAAGSRAITWRPDISWPDHKIAEGGARAVVTAWSLDNTPDYMVVDISAAAQPNTQKYYPEADCLPGGLLGNPDYRTTSIVMRKIMAKDVEWTMGSTTLESNRISDRETTHKVTLTNNYYIGVFPVTQSQWGLIQTSRPEPSFFSNPNDRAMRPVEQVCYNEIRNAANSTTADAAYNWPAAPNPGSFLGLLQAKTGIDFDLPSEAQWEFAARAGNGSPFWGDGSGIQNNDADTNLDRLGRYQRNGGQTYNGSAYVSPDASCGAENGTAIVGSYQPNGWGLYDMCGNVWEWCLDFFKADITALNGAVNTMSGSTRVRRGGSWGNRAGQCRPAGRYDRDPANRGVNDGGNIYGFRLACQANLK